MKNTTVVKRYARALLELGLENGEFSKYGQELKHLADALAAIGEEARPLTSPLLPEGLRQKLLTAILAKADLSPLLANFIHLLMDKGHLNDLSDVAEAYNILADEEKGLIRATITSASSLGALEAASIRDALATFSQRQVELTLKEDPALIGGLVAELGDLTIDGSVLTQIGKMAETLERL